MKTEKELLKKHISVEIEAMKENLDIMNCYIQNNDIEIEYLQNFHDSITKFSDELWKIYYSE